MIKDNKHPLAQFIFCPKCGSETFTQNNEKSNKCHHCGFTYYFNPSAAVVCLIRNKQGDLLVARRAHNPGKGELDMPGGFVDSYETGEEAVIREVKEECNLAVTTVRYLFSLPNLYMYSDFLVHTLDLFYECEVLDFSDLRADDDVQELFTLKKEDIDLSLFAFESVRNGLKRYLSNL